MPRAAVCVPPDVRHRRPVREHVGGARQQPGVRGRDRSLRVLAMPSTARAATAPTRPRRMGRNVVPARLAGHARTGGWIAKLHESPLNDLEPDHPRPQLPPGAGRRPVAAQAGLRRERQDRVRPPVPDDLPGRRLPAGGPVRELPAHAAEQPLPRLAHGWPSTAGGRATVHPPGLSP
jgi:hypothetical protein